MEQNIQIIKDILKKYCVPNKEHNGVTLTQVAEEILKSLVPVGK